MADIHYRSTLLTENECDWYNQDGQIEVGWSCPLENPSQNCSFAIARWQICDGIEHCRLYGEDESAGCRLYPSETVSNTVI